MYKKIYKGGFAVFAILFILSILFYKERMILLDESLYLFNIVKDNTFSIEHFRFIAVVTELFPLIARRLSLPLDVITMSYSAGFVIYFFTCYIICGTVLKQYRIAITLLLYLILFSAHTFFWMLSEFTQGVALLCVLIAYMASDNYRKYTWLTVLVILVVVPTLVFAHPLILFPLSFYMVYLYLRGESNIRLKDCILVFSVFALALAMKFVFFKEPYDSNALGGSFVRLKELFPDYINIHSVRRFAKNCLLQYQWIPILFFIISAFYIRSRQWKQLALFLAYFGGYTSLVCISFPGADTGDFYIENLFLPLGLFLAIPFVFDVMPAFKKSAPAYTLTAMIAVTAFIRIGVFQEFYTARVGWLRSYLSQHADKKLMVDSKHLPMDTLLMPWGSPYEMWLLSTMEHGKTASIIFSDHIDELVWAAPSTKSLIATWGVFSYGALDAQYFIFADTNTGYRVIR